MDFIDAGRIDGLTEGGIYFRIMAPLMAPAFGAMAILGALQSWNNFLWPLIVMRTGDMFTLPVGLAGLLTPYGNNYDVLDLGFPGGHRPDHHHLLHIPALFHRRAHRRRDQGVTDAVGRARHW